MMVNEHEMQIINRAFDDYPYLCPTCKHEDTELCEWCGHNQNYEPKERSEDDKQTN